MGRCGGRPMESARAAMFWGVVSSTLARRSVSTRFQLRKTTAWRREGKWGRSIGAGVGPVGRAAVAEVVVARRAERRMSAWRGRMSIFGGLDELEGGGVALLDVFADRVVDVIVDLFLNQEAEAVAFEFGVVGVGGLLVHLQALAGDDADGDFGGVHLLLGGEGLDGLRGGGGEGEGRRRGVAVRGGFGAAGDAARSEEHTSELQSRL